MLHVLLMAITERCCDRNEVEVVNVPRFMHTDVRDFVNAVSATQNIWRQR